MAVFAQEGCHGVAPVFVRLAAVAIVAAACRPALAARPLITDDARIVDPGSCQLESWMQFQSGGNEIWALRGAIPPATWS